MPNALYAMYATEIVDMDLSKSSLYAWEMLSPSFFGDEFVTYKSFCIPNAA